MQKIDDLMLKLEKHKEIIIVFRGQKVVDFAHAACFVRNVFGKTRQLLLLDCKNKQPLAYPRMLPDQLHQYGESVKAKEDLQAGYYEWDLYFIEKREVEDDEERMKIWNRMMYVLTGEKEYMLKLKLMTMPKVFMKKKADAE